MKILTTKLPSGGFGSIDAVVDIEPLTYTEIIEYSRHKSTGSVLDDLLWDIEKLIMRIRQWEDISSYDLYPLICYTKMLSVSLNGDITFTNGEKVSLADVEFTDINKKAIAMTSIELGGKQYKPSIKPLGQFYKQLMDMRRTGNEELELMAVAVFLGASYDDVAKFTLDDIVICNSIYKNILSQPAAKLEGGEEVVLFGRASELFQILLRCATVNTSKIQYDEVSQD